MLPRRAGKSQWPIPLADVEPLLADANGLMTTSGVPIPVGPTNPGSLRQRPG